MRSFYGALQIHSWEPHLSHPDCGASEKRSFLAPVSVFAEYEAQSRKNMCLHICCTMFVYKYSNQTWILQAQNSCERLSKYKM